MRGGTRKITGIAATERPAAFPLRPSAGPSLEYRRHFDVEAPAIDARAFRTGWRPLTRLAALLEAGQISHEAFTAGMVWRGWVEALGRVPVQRWTARIGSAVLHDGATPLQAVAARALRDAGAAFGPYRIRILFDHLVEDLSWRELGLKLRLDPKTAIVRAVASLEALACWRAGRPLPPAPVERFRIQPSSW